MSKVIISAYHLENIFFIFIHSSVNGHLGYFHVLATVNSAAMKIKVPYPFRLEFCLDICSGVELLNHMVVQFLVF